MHRNRYTNLTLFTLFVGYAGYYLCRANLPVAIPLIIRDLSSQGIDKEVMGKIGSLGVLAYAIGKIFNGVIGDFIGGKKVFIIGMFGSVAATVLFGISSGAIFFIVFWFLNRLIQSMGWSGLVKIVANWVDYRRYGSMMGIVSLSYLVGDILAKLILGQLIKWEFDWRTLFFVSAAMLAAIGVMNVLLLKEKPSELGLPMPEANPNNLFADKEDTESRQSLRELLLPYFKSPSFLLILVMSFGLTAVRESLNFWTPTYLHEVGKLSEGDSAIFSSLFLVLGGASIVLSGWISDKLFKGNRGLVIMLACLPMAVILFLMTYRFESAVLPVVLVSSVGFFLLGPYSFLGGAMAMDVGGKKGAATASGLVDGIGYFGGTLALWGTGKLSKEFGWNSSFLALSIVAGLTALAAFIYFFNHEKNKHT